MKQSAHFQANNKIRRYAFSCVTVITLTALLLAALLVSLANDAYAFVKPDRAVTLTVSDPLSLSELSALLARLGVVSNPTIFRLYADAKGMRSRLEEFSGELTLNSSMSYREILQAFAVV